MKQCIKCGVDIVSSNKHVIKRLGRARLDSRCMKCVIAVQNVCRWWQRRRLKVSSEAVSIGIATSRTMILDIRKRAKIADRSVYYGETEVTSEMEGRWLSNEYQLGR